MRHFQMADRPFSPRPGLSEEEFFLRLGPYPNIYIGMGFPFYIPHSTIFLKKNKIINYLYWIGWTSYKFYYFVL